MFGGQLGGPMAALGPLIAENLGVQRAPIEVREEGLRHSVRIGDAVDFEIEDVVRSVSRRRAGADRRDVPSRRLEFRVAKATRTNINAFGIEYEGSPPVGTAVLLGRLNA